MNNRKAGLTFRKSVLWGLVIMMAGSLSVRGDAAVDDGVQTLRQVSRAFSSVAEKAMPAVVAVQVESVVRVDRDQFWTPFDDDFFDRFFGPRQRPRSREPQQRRRTGQASGFLISDDGYVLTNHHVIERADTIRILMGDGRVFEDVEVVGSDDQSDVALLKIADVAGLPYAELGDSDDLYVGEWVVAIGNPFGLTETLTVGVVSAKGRRVSHRADDYQDFIQTDAAINPGNSGGPLLNLDGRVVGINTAIITGTGGYMGVGLAVPINMASSIKDQLIATGQVQRGFLGIRMQNLTPELAEFFEVESANGVLVMSVEPNSPAEEGGLMKEDVIIGVDGRDIANSNEIRNLIGFTSPGTEVDVVVIRNGQRHTLTVTVGSRDDSELAATGQIGRQLGLRVEAIDEQLAREHNLTEGQGVRVAEVTPGSPADRAGVQPGMVIYSVNRQEVESVSQFNEALKETEDTGRALMLVQTGRFSQYVLLRLP